MLERERTRTQLRVDSTKKEHRCWIWRARVSRRSRRARAAASRSTGNAGPRTPSRLLHHVRNERALVLVFFKREPLLERARFVAGRKEKSGKSAKALQPGGCAATDALLHGLHRLPLPLRAARARPSGAPREKDHTCFSRRGESKIRRKPRANVALREREGLSSPPSPHSDGIFASFMSRLAMLWAGSRRRSGSGSCGTRQRPTTVSI